MNSAIKSEKRKEIDMLNGPILPGLFKFALPILLSGILQQFYSTADTLVVGAMGGKEALAAVGATGSTVSLLVTVFASIFVGTNILVARAKGTGDELELKRIVSTTYIMSLSIGLFITIVGVFFSRTLLEWTDCPSHIIDDSTRYLQIYFLGMIPSMFTNFAASVIRSSGNSRSPFIYLSISGLTNVVSNVIFVLILGNPVTAVALATLLSMVVGAVLFAIHLIRDKSATGLRPFKLDFHYTIFIKTIKYGIPAAISSSCFALTNFIIQPTLNSYGDVGISGSAASTSIEAYIYVITASLSAAVSTFIGQNIGAGNKARVKEVIVKSYIIGVTVMALFSVVVLSMGRILLGFFIPGEVEAIEFGYLRMQMIVGVAAVNAVMNINGGTLQAYGYTFVQMLSNLIGVCFFRVMWMWFIYPLDPSPFNFLICYPVTWIITALTLFVAVILLTKKYLKGEKDFKI